MNPDLEQLEKSWRTTIDRWLAQRDESALSQAYEIGRQAVSGGFGLLEMVATHRRVLSERLRMVSSVTEYELFTGAAGELLAEGLAAFEMALRGYGTAIAELRQANSELELARQEAVRQSQFKSQFLAGMSHELRTPLNAIIGFSELLADQVFGPLNEKQKEYVDNVYNSGHHLLSLINDILDLSKVEAGKLDLRFEWTSVAAIVDSVSSVVVPLAREKEVALDLTVPDALPELYVDPLRMKQVLYNLLSNAIKFTPKNGSVRLAVTAEDKHMSLSVEDTGIGIRRQDLDRLFKEFERIEPVSGPRPEGTGLGLALTKRLVEMHGGSVSVQSKVKKGSTFTVTVPILRQGTPLPKLAPEHGPRPEPPVLVIEDDRHAAELLAGHLHSAGIDVAFASNADEAVRLAGELRPVAITLDILMTGIDGWGILQRLKASPETAQIPVIVVTVVEDPNRGLILGAADYLVKPVSRNALLESLESVGVPVHSVAGSRVLLVADASDELASLEAYLRNAGCEVSTVSPPSIEAIARELPASAILVDLRGDPRRLTESVEKALESRGETAIPIIAIGAGDAAGEGTWKLAVKTIVEREALRPEVLVRAVRAAIDRGSTPESFQHAPTGLPGPRALLNHLRVLIRRADNDFGRIVLIALRVPLPSEPQRFAWADLLRPRLRPGDFMAVAGDGALVLVRQGVDAAPAVGLAERFADLVSTTIGIRVDEPCVAWFPDDGRRAEDLLKTVLARLEGDERAAAP